MTPTDIAKVIVILLFCVFWVVAFVILYHLARFGVGALPKKLSTVFIAGAFILFSWSVVVLTNLELAKLKL